MIGVAIAITVVGLAMGIVLREFMWFARSGALVVAVGLALLSRASVIGEPKKIDVTMSATGLSDLDPEHYRRTGEPIPDWLVEDLETSGAVGFWGPMVSAVGILIWGFGDLLNQLLNNHA